MSSFKKNTLAAALVVGMGFAGSVAAYQYWTAGNVAPEMVASFDINGTTTQTVTMTQDVEVRVQASDLIVGRTTGFTVRFGLNNSLFSPGATSLNTAPGAYNGSDLPAGWLVTVVSQTTNAVVFNVVPPETAPGGIVPGEIIAIPGLALKSIEELATPGGVIDATVFFADAVTATELPNSRNNNFQLLKSGNPLTSECDATAGDTLSRIDVAGNDTFDPKTAFSSTGEIGGADGLDFDFGDYTMGTAPGFTFSYQPTDEFVTVLTGANGFDAFDSIYLSTDDCATSAVDGDIDGNTVTFEYDLGDVLGGPDGFTVSVCGTANGDDQIADNNPISINTVATRGTNDVTMAACNLLPLLYNGSVVKVYNVNPANVSSAESFIRVINQSAVAGKVTVVGWDDNGNFRGPLTFNLPAKNSRQFNSQDIEAGNAAKLTGAFGDGVGKWRLEVTGEFPSMRVSSLNRNYTDGTVTNLTDADGQGEQSAEAIFD